MTNVVAILAFAFAFLVFCFLAFGDLTNQAKWMYLGFAGIALGLLMMVVGPGVSYMRARQGSAG